jgi:hypothetical protein
MLDELSRKFDRTKRAAGSYVHDQVEQTCAIAVSYAIVAGLYSAVAILSIAALLVGATASLRWFELHYGLFEALGSLAAFLVVAALICAILAIYRLKRPAKPIAPLASRLRAAVTAAPSADQVGPAATIASLSTKPPRSASVMSGVVVASSLIGWALMRRRNSPHSG